MKKAIIRCLILSLASIGACRERPRLIVEKYANGQTKSEIFYIYDSIKHGKAKYYHLNGTLKGEIVFFDGNRNGTAEYYYSNGKLEGHVEYSHDTVNGAARWYFSNGQLRSKSSWVNGRQYGSGYFYNEKGNLITYPL